MLMKKLCVSLMMALMGLSLLVVQNANADRGGRGNHGREVEFRIELTGNAIDGIAPEGRAEFRARDDDRRRLKVEVEGVNLPGAVLNVRIDHQMVGQITIEADELEGRLELESRDGDQVPSVHSGSTIVITDNAGTTILSGTF